MGGVLGEQQHSGQSGADPGPQPFGHGRAGHSGQQNAERGTQGPTSLWIRCSGTNFCRFGSEEKLTLFARSGCDGIVRKLNERVAGVAVLLGVDLGGSSIRAVLTDENGRLLGQGRSAGGNLRSSVGDPAGNLKLATRGALLGAGLTGAEVTAVAIGAAGAAEARGFEVAQLLARGLHQAGVSRSPIVVPDTEIAYRAVAETGDGVLLLAGTGAIAVRHRRWVTAVRRDGLGWLLGDLGSGAWLGLAALRAVAADLDARGPRTALTPALLARLDVTTESASDPRQGLIRAVDELRPAQFAALTPLLADHADDPVVSALFDQAAGLLWETVEALGLTADDELVLAGGLLAGGPVRERIETRRPGVRHAAHPVVGACALAAAAADLTLDREALTAALR
ncbi:N-acetylglucosamine kinase [Enemella evansiae]|nr:N-acetylglucosamine kinase [Enemella evansiae]